VVRLPAACTALLPAALYLIESCGQEKAQRDAGGARQFVVPEDFVRERGRNGNFTVELAATCPEDGPAPSRLFHGGHHPQSDAAARLPSEEIVQVDQMLQRSEEAAKARELKVSSRDLAAI